MSRTRHALPTHNFHRMKVQNRRKMEASVIDQLNENEVLLNQVRHSNRLMAYWSIIPDPWDDKNNSSGREYHNKNYWVKWREAANAPHWTKGTMLNI